MEFEHIQFDSYKGKFEKSVFIHHNIKLRARNLNIRDNKEGSYDPFNLDYIFKEDNPLDQWLAEAVAHLLPDADFLDL